MWLAKVKGIWLEINISKVTPIFFYKELVKIKCRHPNIMAIPLLAFVERAVLLCSELEKSYLYFKSYASQCLLENLWFPIIEVVYAH